MKLRKNKHKFTNIHINQTKKEITLWLESESKRETCNDTEENSVNYKGILKKYILLSLETIKKLINF